MPSSPRNWRPWMMYRSHSVSEPKHTIKRIKQLIVMWTWKWKLGWLLLLLNVSGNQWTHQKCGNRGKPESEYFSLPGHSKFTIQNTKIALKGWPEHETAELEFVSSCIRKQIGTGGKLVGNVPYPVPTCGLPKAFNYLVTSTFFSCTLFGAHKGGGFLQFCLCDISQVLLGDTPLSDPLFCQLYVVKWPEYRDVESREALFPLAFPLAT